MKTSKEYFNRFKKEFLHWQKELGLTQYRIVFHHKKLKDSYAEIEVCEKGKLAEVYLTTEIKLPKQDPGPESHGKHEVLHLLTHRLVWLADSRHIKTNDINEEWESIAVRLEKVLK